MKTEKLKAIYSGQNSFYGKAKVNYLDNGTKELISYKTKVAIITKGGNFIRLWEGYSLTTMNHINDFRKQNGLDFINKKDWDEMPVKEKNGMAGKRTVFVLRDFSKKKTKTEIFELDQKQYCFTRASKKLRDKDYRMNMMHYSSLKHFIENPENDDMYQLDNATLSVERI